MPLDVGNATLYVPDHLREPQMSDVLDDLIDRQSPPNDPARIAAVVASEARFAYFGTAAFAIRLQRLDQKIVSGVPMSLTRQGAFRPVILTMGLASSPPLTGWDESLTTRLICRGARLPLLIRKRISIPIYTIFGQICALRLEMLCQVELAGVP